MKLLDKFLPKEEILKTLSYREEKKVKVLLTGDAICLVMFMMFSAGLFAIGHAATGASMLAMCFVFLCSMLLTKKGKMVFGSYLTSIGLLVASIIVAFMTSHVDHPVVNYRTVCFCIALACLNYMISLRKGQLILYMAASIVLLVASTFVLHYPEEFMSDPKEWTSSVVINIMAIICSNSLLIAANKSNDQIVEHSEKEHEQANESLATITSVLNQLKESMNVGHKLNGAANAASESVNSIQDVYKNLISETDNLDHQTLNIKAAGSVVQQHSSEMTNSILEQNHSISEISSAISTDSNSFSASATESAKSG